MHDLQAAFQLAFRLIFTGDADLMEIIGLSMGVSLTAVLLACVIGMILGAAAGVLRFPGRPAVIIFLNALMGLPPVVVGLGVYLLLSRAGPLGVFGLLYTPTAMIVAQTILVTPIVAALTRQVVEDLYEEYDEQLSFKRVLCHCVTVMGGPNGIAKTRLYLYRTAFFSTPKT